MIFLLIEYSYIIIYVSDQCDYYRKIMTCEAGIVKTNYAVAFDRVFGTLIFWFLLSMY